MFGNLNTGTISTNKKGRFGLILCCLDKEDIYDIFSIPKLEKMGFRITYDSRY